MSISQLPLNIRGAGGALLLGILCGVAAALLSRAVYASEDFFERIHLHWMWWPAIGGVVVGVGGLIFPRALGTGYDVIGGFVAGNVAWKVILGVLIVKSLIWAFSLGSGTSGGIMAPLLMIGGAMGAAASYLLPAMQPGGWALVGMAGIFSGAIGCPLTAAMMSVELTHNYELLVPALIGAISAHAVTVLVQKRSILTERLSRRGYHLSREYGVDPLETMTVAEVMSETFVTLPAILSRERLESVLESNATGIHLQRLFPVVTESGRLLGVVRRRELALFAAGHDEKVAEVTLPYGNAITSFPGETLRLLAEKMARSELYAVPVVALPSGQVVGMVTVEELLAARVRSHDHENLHRRIRQLRIPFGRREIPVTESQS